MPFKQDMQKTQESSCTPLYQQVKRSIQAQIVAGNLARNEKLPGMTELAKTFDVSLITIDAALKQLIEEGVCYRRPKKGTYVGGADANLDKKDRQRLIAVYSEHGNLEFDSVMKPFLSGIHNRIQQFERTDMLLLSGPDFERRLNTLCANHGAELAGVVIAGNLSGTLASVVKHPEIRFVLLNFQQPDFASATPENIFGVFNDEFCGGYAATSYLINKGARKIAAIHYDVQDLNYKLRLAGFAKAHEDAGLIPDREMIYDVTKRCDLPPMERGALALCTLLEKGTPNALFCVNDLLAAGAVSHLKTLEQPPSIEVMGFDNLVPDISFSRGFSTVIINTDQMGRCAVNALLDRKAYPGKQLFIAPQLLLRTSAGSVTKSTTKSKV